jgi:putrescine transport system ATP-binding protein
MTGLTAVDGTDEATPAVAVEGLTRRIDGKALVDGVDLALAEGEVCALLGASGAGKSTLLRIIAGLEPVDGGRVRIGGLDMTATPPWRRPVNMMFQSYALFPHLTVYQNVAFGLAYERLSGEEKRRRIRDALDMVKMSPFGWRHPEQLSGGERQRVALARSLVKRPKLLLLDEPLAALDRKLREDTQLELMRIQRQMGIAFLMVTHDPGEAMAMSDRLAVMRAGRLVQVGRPADVYEFPADRFVARFLGPVNLVTGRVREVTRTHGVLDCPTLGATLMMSRAAGVMEGIDLTLAIRPEKMLVSRSPAAPGPNAVNGTVDQVIYGGIRSTYFVRADSGALLEVVALNQGRGLEGLPQVGASVSVTWGPDAAVVVDE